MSNHVDAKTIGEQFQPLSVRSRKARARAHET